MSLLVKRRDEYVEYILIKIIELFNRFHWCRNASGLEKATGYDKDVFHSVAANGERIGAASHAMKGRLTRRSPFALRKKLIDARQLHGSNCTALELQLQRPRWLLL